MNPSRRRARRAYYVFRTVAPFAFALWLAMANLYFATAITADPFRLAMLLVVLEVSSFAFETPTGLIADSFSRKWSMVIGYLIWGGGFLLQAFVPIYEVTLVSQAIWGLGFTFVSGAPEAWLVDELGQEEASALFLRGAQIAQVSTLLGIAASTALATLHLALPIALERGGYDTAGGAAGGGHAGRRIPAGRVKGLGIRAIPAYGVSATIRLVRERAVLRSVVFIGVVIGSSVGGFDALYAPHIVQDFVLPVFEPEIWFGLLLAGVTLADLTLARIDETAALA